MFPFLRFLGNSENCTTEHVLQKLLIVASLFEIQGSISNSNNNILTQLLYEALSATGP